MQPMIIDVSEEEFTDAEANQGSFKAFHFKAGFRPHVISEQTAIKGFAYLALIC